jgi:hypothetical protein
MTATDVSITILTEGGFYIVPRNCTFSDITILSGSNHEVHLSLFGLGLGFFFDPLIIKVNVTASNMDDISESFSAKLFIRWIEII